MTSRNSEAGGVPRVGSTGKLTTLTEKMNSLPESRRKAVDERARELIAEEMSLQAMRKARKFTQAKIAEGLGVNQENVSRLERRSDFLISSLRNYIEAMGGELRIVVDFPDYRPVAITGFADLEDGWPDPKTDTEMFARLTDDFAAAESEGISAMPSTSGWFTDDYSVGSLEMSKGLGFFPEMENDSDAYKAFIEQAARAFCTYLSDSSDYPVDRALTFLDREKDKEDVEQAVGKIMSILTRSTGENPQGGEEDSARALYWMKSTE